MKKTITRRITVLMLSLAMVLTMGMSVFAAGGTSGGTEDSKAKLGGDKNMVAEPSAGTPEDISKSGVRQDGRDVVESGTSTHGEYQAVENTVRIYKEIIIFNTNSADTLVYLPNIEYTYSVAAATGVAEKKYITDEYGLSATIQNGVSAAIKTSSATVKYSSASGITPTKTDPNNGYVITNKDGKEARGYFDVEFDPTKFEKPGVYRYVISESADDREEAGVTNDMDQYDSKRYLDVYVQNQKDATTGEFTDDLEIYGYALYEDKTAGKDKEFKAAEGPLGAKSNGFVSEKFDEETQAYSRTEKDVDIYDTANIKIEKKTTGAMGDKTNEFPFEATFKNSKIKANAKFSYQIVKKGDTLSTVSTSNPTKELNAEVKIGAATASGADNFKLKDTEYIYVYGVPGKSEVDRSVDSAVTTVDVKEYNNTTDDYDVSAKYTSRTATDTAIDVTSDGTTDKNVKMPTTKDAAAATQNLSYKQTEDKMVVTNAMNAISPTNVVMRFAPYLFMLGAAVLLFMMSRRRRSEEE